MLDFDLTVPSLIMVQCQVAQACKNVQNGYATPRVLQRGNLPVISGVMGPL